MECNFGNCPNFERLGKKFADRISELEQENERLQKLTCFNCGEETLSPSGAEIYDKILVYKQTLQEIKEKCNEARRTGRKAYLPIDILDVITKAEEE